MKKYLKVKSSIALIIFGLSVLLISIFLFISLQLLNVKSETFTIENFSHFGGFIGGIVGSIWSLAGFILFYVALNKQKEDLELNRQALTTQITSMNLQTQEFKAQVQELEETRKVYIEQNKTQNLQRFENTFFNMLSLHHQIVEGIDLNFKEFLKFDSTFYLFFNDFNRDIGTGHEIYKSRDVFKKTYAFLYFLIEIDYFNITNNPEKLREYITTDVKQGFKKLKLKKEKIQINNVEFDSHFSSIYNLIYDKLNTDFGHYFRNLYRLIKMIDEHSFDKNTEIDFKHKYYYTTIVRSQLSDYELLWLFFNCIYIYGEKFKPLVEKYAFFKILRHTEDELLIKYKSFYKNNAFGLKK